MNKISALQKARAAYAPKLPAALANGAAVTVNEGGATTAVADVEKVKALFPATFGSPVLTFAPGKGEASAARNVGVILSGGQAPGGHNVIAGLYDGLKSLNKANRLYGFLKGPDGLVKGEMVELTDEIIDAIASEPKIVKYLDIPIQHINNEILKRMNRKGTGDEIRALFKKLRCASLICGKGKRSFFIVGSRRVTRSISRRASGVSAAECRSNSSFSSFVVQV